MSMQWMMRWFDIEEMVNNSKVKIHYGFQIIYNHLPVIDLAHPCNHWECLAVCVPTTWFMVKPE